jgi:pimeloyl-ACP methyl ester carboxylesterase
MRRSSWVICPLALKSLAMLAMSAPLAMAGVVACHPPAPTPEPTPTAAPTPEPTPTAAPTPHHFVGTLTLPSNPPRTIDWLIRYDLGDEANAKLWIPTQNVDAFAATSVTAAEDGAITMSWALLKITWTISADGTQCEFEQGGVEVNCVVEEIDAQAFAEYTERQRPQTPLPPFPYVSVNLRIPNPDAEGVSLAATLTKPESPGPHPVVVLVSGSGAQDRDETIFGHKPFLVIADALTRRGIAVIRYDDRGWGESTGDPTTGTTADFASDTLAVLRFVAARPDIDPKRVGIIGHSEGGMIAPMLAAAHPNDVAFIVMLAGPGVIGHELLTRQTELGMRLGTSDETRIAADMAVLSQVYKLIASKPVDEAKPAIEALWKQAKPDEPGLDALLALADSAWMRFFLAYDPRPDLVKIKCPVLVLNGATDIQVDDEQNLPAITAAFKKAKNKQVTVLARPGLNHLFQHSETGNPEDYEKIEETFDKETLALIGDWVLERVLP